LVELQKALTAAPGKFPARSFFEGSPELVAPRLLGKLLARKFRGRWLVGRIVEAEAYLGPHAPTPDPAAHSYRGATPRNQILFGAAGHAYVYTIYGRYFCMNISCEPEGRAGCVLLRALEPIAGLAQMAANRGLDAKVARPKDLTAGPSRLCQALALTRAEHNTLDLLSPHSPLQLRDDGFRAAECLATPRISINPANAALDWPLRFILPGNPCVSGPRSGAKNLHGLRHRIR
jgi:DNA-3-methyladenine glycosylase